MTERMQQVYDLVKNSRYGDVRGVMSANKLDLENSVVFGNSYRALVRKNKIVKSEICGDKVYIAML
jgi:hypothetical protein